MHRIMTDDGDPKADVSKRAPEAGEDVAARIAALETELEKAREEARQSHERWLRERADLENLKKRIARERAETMKFANESVLRDLLPIVDNLERAVAHAESGGDGQPLVEGVALVLKSLLDVLERHGVKRIERSEEHTSELQSRLHLVCRLLLEKKKTRTDQSVARVTSTLRTEGI